MTIADDWFAPLSAAREWGFDGPLEAGSSKATGLSCGIVLADDRLVTVRDNVIVEFGMGMLVADLPTAGTGLGPVPPTNQIVGNLIVSKKGPAIWATSRGADIVMAQNALTGEPTGRTGGPFPITGPVQHGATVDVTADSVIAIGNRFGCGGTDDVPPSYSVGIQASEIAFVSNQSTCDVLPSKTNVLLRGLARVAGSGQITAVSNCCKEPKQVTKGDFRRRFEEVLAGSDVPVETRTALTLMSADFVSDDHLLLRLRQPISGVVLPAALQSVIDAADAQPQGTEPIEELRNDLNGLELERSEVIAKYMASEATAADIGPQLERLTDNQLSLAERIRLIEAVDERPTLYSLIVTGPVSVTGQNILSHGLLRSGTGSDSGTVQNVT